MKKVFLSAVALFSALSMSAENSIYLAPLTVTPGQTNVAAAINFDLEDLDVVDLAFEVYLPSGFTFVGGGRKGDTYLNGTTTKFTDRAQYMFDKGSGLWAGSINNNAEKGYYLKVGGVGSVDDYIEGYTGKFMDVFFNVASTVEPGIYPVVFKNCEFNTFGNHEVVLQSYVSYVVVGNPTAQTLTMAAGELPAFVNEKLATQEGISKLDLTAVTAVNGTFTYVDGREVVAPTASVEADLKYVGNNANYYSVKVPFAANTTGDVNVFKSADANYAIFDPTTSVAKDQTVLAKGATTFTGHGAIAGVEKLTGQSGNYVKDGTFYYGDNLTVKPMRGLFEGTSLSNLRVVVDGELTGINAAEIDAQSNTFDIQGRQVQNAKNGVYVVNGKKQFVK